MSQFSEIRADFNRRCARGGWQHPSDCEGNWPVPTDRWLRRFYGPTEFRLANQRRLVNHFLVGADPEFVCMATDGHKVPATGLGLKAGLAFGADNNGRLIELRPQPSRFALEVLASLASTLKWMAILCPNAAPFVWRAGAYADRDGLGGHVHFGRRRPTARQETSALDTLSFYMSQAGIWDRAEMQQRIVNAQGGHYGQLGDRRQQPYGYEYRTFPSWLCSPWMAYLSLVLSKLAVHDPDLVPTLEEAHNRLDAAHIRFRLQSLLAYFKHIDDDAALACQVLERRGWPRWHTNDLKPEWGIMQTSRVGMPTVNVTVIPGHIPPKPEEVEQCAAALLGAYPPVLADLAPSWKPSQLPVGYEYVPSLVATEHAPGVGELFVGVCTGKNPNSRLVPMSSGHEGLYVATWLMTEGWRYSIGRVFPDLRHRLQGTPGGLHLGPQLRENGMRQRVREWLLSGFFPYWDVSEVTDKSAAEWLGRCKGLTARKSVTSKPIELETIG